MCDKYLNIEDQERIKTLKRKLSNLKTNLKGLLEAKEKYEKELKSYGILEENDVKLETLKKRKKDNRESYVYYKISDHAVVRYFERVLGFDIRDIKGLILPLELRNNMPNFTSIPIYNEEGAYSHTIKITNRAVVTVTKGDKLK